MDTLKIKKTILYNGAKISIPSSKSYIHRYLISALLSEGTSVIKNVTFSNDISATLSCIKALGAEVNVSCDNTVITVKGGIKKTKYAILNCGESASTMRFMIPVAMLFCEEAEFVGAESLLKRPLEPYFKIFEQNGMEYEFEKGKFLKVKGSFNKNIFKIDGGVSSQFVTGLLFTLPLLNGESEIVIEGKLQSVPYVDITLEVLKNSGIEIENINYERFIVKGNQKFVSSDFFTQGDYSQAAFWLVLGAFCGKIEICNMEHNSLQGDRIIVDILRKMGAKIYDIENGFSVEKSRLSSIGKIYAKDFPDIVPILSLACALAEGTTVIEGIERLRIKESDRVFATVCVLSNLGADIREENNTLIINGKNILNGGTVDSFNDHRMAMTAAVASLKCENPVEILNPMSINKSYPEFYDDLLKTGGVKYEWNMGR